MKKLLVAASLIFIPGALYSQELPKGAIRVFPDQIQWGEAPPSLPPGAKVYMLEGSPMQEGIFTMRVKFPPYYKLPAHWHPNDERITVLEGAVYVGFGETMDTTNAQKFTPGCYYVNPKESHHYVFTQSEGVIMQMTGLGPWGITYIEEKK
jgi:quercetin dioxygenase-like cupin family protein